MFIVTPYESSGTAARSTAGPAQCALCFAVPLLSKRKARKYWTAWIGRAGLTESTVWFLLSCYRSGFITTRTMKFLAITAMANAMCTENALHALFCATLDNDIDGRLYRSILSAYCGMVGVSRSLLKRFQQALAVRFSCSVVTVPVAQRPGSMLVYFEGSKRNEDVCRSLYRHLVTDIVTFVTP